MRHESSCAAQNLFSELEYIRNFRVNFEDMTQVHNLVGTSLIVNSQAKLDFRAISNMLPNSRFENKKIVGKILIHPPRAAICTVLLFTSGKMVLTGCKSMLDCILASSTVFKQIQQGFPGIVFILEPVKIQNIVVNAQIRLKSHEKLDLQKFYNDHNIFCTYQPNMFPWLIYRPSNMPIVLLVFYSGKVVITGAKSMQDVYSGWAAMSEFLKKLQSQKVVRQTPTKKKI